MHFAPSPEILRAVVRHYRLREADRRREATWWKAAGKPLSEAIRLAARALAPDGKHSHQQLLPPDVLRACAAALMADEASLAGCKTFAALLARVELVLSPIRGAGEMIVYDAADRIGHRLNLEPELIYLHRGTRGGALALINDLRPRDKAIRVDQLPAELQVLTPREAEDVLCTYKKVFLGLCGVPDDDRSSCGARRRRGASC